MRNIRTAALMMFAGMTAIAVTSCRDKDIFNKEVYKDITHGEYPVDTLDENHTWSLLQTMRVKVTADVAGADIATAQILNANPYRSSAEIMAEKSIGQGQSAWMSFDMPITQDVLYAALITTAGQYYVKQFNTGEDEIIFSEGTVISKGTLTTLKQQTYTYLYEESFPEPTDFDYNDLVLRISKKTPAANILQLTVTLAATGASKSMAAAIRLVGIKYEQVEEATIEEGSPLDYDYPLTRHKLKGNQLLVKGRSGEAVINLFEDAHWSLRHETELMGNIGFLSYNTTHYETEGSAMHLPIQTRTYNIKLKEGVDANFLNLSEFDPFVITQYNSVFFEIHTYKYKFDEVVWEYMGKDKRAYDDHLAWALLIPSSTFRYPVEEMPIGTYRNGELFGAYGKYMHSFGQWGRDHNTNQDWWQNPTSALVY